MMLGEASEAQDAGHVALVQHSLHPQLIIHFLPKGYEVHPENLR